MHHYHLSAEISGIVTCNFPLEVFKNRQWHSGTVSKSSLYPYPKHEDTNMTARTMKATESPITIPRVMLLGRASTLDYPL